MKIKKRLFLRSSFYVLSSIWLSQFSSLLALENSKIINPNLTEEQKKIMFDQGTERAGTSILNYEKRKGSYYCANCNTKLFNSVSIEPKFTI